MRVVRLFALFLVTVAVLAVDTRADEHGTGDDPTVIYLMRHAEAKRPPYENDPPNPPLNEAGRQRAEQLTHVLADAGVTKIFSSDYNRTRETIGPLSEQLGLQVTLYDPRALQDFAAKLRSMSGRLVVAGHSNTTPALVGFLGGEPGEPMEKVEFDRLYIVTLQPDGDVSTVLLRYGSAPGN